MEGEKFGLRVIHMLLERSHTYVCKLRVAGAPIFGRSLSGISRFCHPQGVIPNVPFEAIRTYAR